jgi:histidine triad (HIT) family protein
MGCLFCNIVDRSVSAARVLDHRDCVAFLDTAPVFPGHVLAVPPRHIATLTDLAFTEVGPFFAQVQRIAAALHVALGCEGTWVSMNNTVSQSVPHLHVHIVPRIRKDGLRGFYWPRQKYSDTEAMYAMALRISAVLEETVGSPEAES